MRANPEKELGPEILLATQKLIIKAADISSSAVPWEESLEWVQRLLTEFYAQVFDAFNCRAMMKLHWVYQFLLYVIGIDMMKWPNRKCLS